MYRSKNKFLNYLQITNADLDFLYTNIDKQYGSFKRPKLSRRGKPIIENGEKKQRTIHPSFDMLKAIQGKIGRMLTKDQEPILPPYYYGGVKGKCNVRNARFHQGNHYFFLTDIQNFFPSVTNSMVYEALVREGYSYDVAHVITRLCTWKGGLPQGTPTSTILSIIATKGMTEEINKICIDNNIKFSMFVDDITLSSQSDFKPICSAIVDIIRKHGFRIHPKKTVYKKGKAVITGIMVRQNHLSPTCALQYKLKTVQNPLSRKGLVNYRIRIASA